MATIDTMQREISRLLTDFATQLLNVFQGELAKQFAVQSKSLPAGERASRRKRAESPAAGEKPARGRKARVAKAAKPARAKAPRAAKGKRDRSTPDEVNVLKGKILKLLKDSSEELSAKDIENKLSAPHGPFNYALNQLKKRGAVKQHGERRFARYSIGRASAVDAVNAGSARKGGGKGRGRKPAAAKAPEAAEAPEATEQA